MSVSFGDSPSASVPAKKSRLDLSASTDDGIVLRTRTKKRKRSHSTTGQKISSPAAMESTKTKFSEAESILETTKSPPKRRDIKIPGFGGALNKFSPRSLMNDVISPKSLEVSKNEEPRLSPRRTCSVNLSPRSRGTTRKKKRLSRNMNKELGISHTIPREDEEAVEVVIGEGEDKWWNTDSYIYGKWKALHHDGTSIPLVSRECLESGYHIESPVKHVEEDLSILELEKNIFFFKQLLDSNIKVKHFYVRGNDPIIVTISGTKETIRKVIIRTITKDIHIILAKSSTPRVMRTLCQKYPKILGNQNIMQVKKDILLWDKQLVYFEDKQISFQEKIGIFCARDGQITEDDFLCNTENSPQFTSFLKLLGKTVDLEGWDRFRGGLDNKTNTTGFQSVYAEHRGFEIMFHVSTMLPYNPNDEQQVCKKRHIGNDVVVIIFKENNVPFDPLCIRSQYNHVFFVIQPATLAGKVYYSVEVTTKPGVPPFPPFFNSPGVYPHSVAFRELLLSKLLNANRAAMHAPDFYRKHQRTRKMIMQDIFESLGARQ